MTLADWQPVVSSLIAGIGLLLTGLIGIYVPRAIDAFERRTGVLVTDQQRAAVTAAVVTAAGLLETKLDQHIIKLNDITPTSPVVLAEVHAVLSRVPESAEAQGVKPETVAAMIVGRTDTTKGFL